MTSRRISVDPDVALDQAARWLARFAAGGVRAGERAAFQEWLAADPEHQRSYGEAQATWSDLDALAGLASSEEQALPVPLREEIARCDARANTALAGPLRRSRARWLTAAAALVVGVFGLQFVYNRYHPQPQAPQSTASRLRTRVGERTHTMLADGSVVWLNTDTEVQVVLSATRRSVHMVSGEAYFEVAKDPIRPFIVSVVDRTITAVGTAFNVFSRGGETRVTVIEGKVEVARRAPRPAGGPRAAAVPSASSAAPEAVPPAAIEAPQGVAAAQTATIGEAATLVAALPVEAISRQAAWRQGLLYFDGVTLKEIVAQLDPYIAARIVIADPTIEGFVGGGVVHVDSAESILTAIARVWPVDVRNESADLIVLTRRN